MEPKNKRQQKKWLTNRAETYNGFIIHFIRSLYTNTLTQHGFEIRRIKRQITEDKSIIINGQHPTKVISVLANGSYFFGKDMLIVQYWAWSEKLSNLLPLQYKR